jgi:hypothetical protein
MNQMLHEVDEVKYVVRVKGTIVSIQFTSQAVAEQHIANLPLDQQMIAEVVPVTGAGQELLLG